MEAPAGVLSPGLTQKEVARRDLLEEVAGTAADLRYIGQCNTSNGISNEVAHVYLATGVACPDCRWSENSAMPTVSQRSVRPSSRRGLTEMRFVPVEGAVRMAHQGEVSDGPSALALLWCEPMLQRSSD